MAGKLTIQLKPSFGDGPLVPMLCLDGDPLDHQVKVVTVTEVEDRALATVTFAGVPFE